MTEENELIWIKKIIYNKDKGNLIDDDIVKKKDIKRIRRWHRNEKDLDISGDITVVTLENISGLPLITIKINESFESISKRLGIDKPIE
mgnify:CR=1 FL=1